jgi:N-acylneuraminate cytidylyltransferase
MSDGHVVAIIPARGGSKSVPNKNIKELNGKPLIVWSIETAKACKNIDDIFVSTDSKEIAAISRDNDVCALMRPACIADDHSLDYQYTLQVIMSLIDITDVKPEIIVQLRPTHPDRDPEVVDRAILEFQNNRQADSLRSVSVATQTPYKMWTINTRTDPYKLRMYPLIEPEGGREEHYNSPRQSLPVVYWQNGYVDITRYDTIMKLGSMTGENIMPWLIDEEPMDIDYPSDWNRLENMDRGLGNAHPS